MSGVGNPIAPPLVLRREGDGVVGTAMLGLAYEGPPTYLHGGMSGLLMDQLLGGAAIAAGLWGMTARWSWTTGGRSPCRRRWCCAGG